MTELERSGTRLADAYRNLLRTDPFVHKCAMQRWFDAETRADGTHESPRELPTGTEMLNVLVDHEAATRTAAGRALYHFAQLYETEHNRTGSGQDSMLADDCGLACLMLATSPTPLLSHRDRWILETCRDVSLIGSYLPWLDALPWDVSLQVVKNAVPTRNPATNSLIAGLGHGDSSIRLYCYKIGWIAREHIDASTVAEVLLRNTADTLGHWWNALGLLNNLHDDQDSFWAVAQEYEPEPAFAEQYADRLRLVRDQERLVECAAALTAYELHIARFIVSSLLDPQGGRSSD